MIGSNANKLRGLAFESDLAKILHHEGFWVHQIQQKAAGQPADLIAVRNGRVFLIDAKDCQNDRFVLSRIEQNQHIAMRMFSQKAKTVPVFALRMEDEIYMLSYVEAHQQLMLKKQKSLSKYWCEVNLPTLEEWVGAV